MLTLRTCRTTIDEQGRRVTAPERRVRNVVTADVSKTNEPRLSSQLNPAAKAFKSLSKLDGKDNKPVSKNSSPSKSSNSSNAFGNGAKKSTKPGSMRDGISTSSSASPNPKKSGAKKKLEPVFPSYRPGPDFSAQGNSTPEQKNATPDRQTFGNYSIRTITNLSPISPKSVAEADRPSFNRASKIKRTRSGPASGAENGVMAPVATRPLVAQESSSMGDLIDFIEPSVQIGMDRSLIPLDFLLEDMKTI
jgi:hypothetical protein